MMTRSMIGWHRFEVVEKNRSLKSLVRSSMISRRMIVASVLIAVSRLRLALDCSFFFFLSESPLGGVSSFLGVPEPLETEPKMVRKCLEMGINTSI